ncbi:MAG: hypothetical protein R6V48_02115, partial [Fidelibacterota bacterium]
VFPQQMGWTPDRRLQRRVPWGVAKSPEPSMLVMDAVFQFNRSTNSPVNDLLLYVIRLKYQ